ncbi:protoporphyrinogen oxidase [Leekyejoonella antrihumi]|uniref:Protoporphyrinogen oxidase n=1 Tax=Leekyejoonella antrihumi TaxID=1660198 RepID=A0A563E628_9MICO|nr:protoporphyrinogen oxidase [Leekyejoonella antrihumi]TWP37990.1 protoporphyrinogen oxidase [Leekyejoonella antrihumi]
MGKLSFLIGFGAGYVVGARAGKERYEQIKLQAGKVWQHPAVQQHVANATEQVKQRGPEVAAAAGQAALRGAGEAAKNAAVAGFSAATGKNRGPVVQSSISDPADADGQRPDGVNPDLGTGGAGA